MPWVYYRPDGDEAQEFWYDPLGWRSGERETAERISGMDFQDFTKGVMGGHARCRRVMLWILLKRQHPTLRFDDVDFSWSELEVQATKEELMALRERAANSMPADQLEGLADMLAAFNQEIEVAPEHPADKGKARVPIAA